MDDVRVEEDQRARWPGEARGVVPAQMEGDRGRLWSEMERDGRVESGEIEGAGEIA